MHVRTSSFCSYCSELCMYVLPVSALIVQNNAWAPSLCLLFRRMLYFQFLFLLFRRYITHSFCSYCSELCMYVLTVSALIVQSYACTYFQFLLLLFRTVHAHMYVQFLPLWFWRMHKLGSHPVSAHVVQKDAWTPCLYSWCSERCSTPSFWPYCSELCMYVLLVSALAVFRMHGLPTPVSAFIVGRPRNYLFLSEKWNRETRALPTSI